MKNSIRFILSAMLMAATGSQRLCAQGTAFTYQGRLNDGANPATGSFDATFTLYDDATLGTQLGDVLTNAPLGLTEGVFTVTLDFGDKFTGEPRWLEIAVRTNGGVFTKLSPRQPLTATPHAIFAANAETLTGSLPANQLTGQIASANIGTGSITAPMLAAGAVGSNQLAAGAVTTSALANGAVTAAKIGGVLSPGQIPNIYSAGGGINLTGNQISLIFDNDGTSATASRADHTHSASEFLQGTLIDSVLSANVALLDTLQSFSASKAFTSGAQVLADTGSAAAPSISFNADDNTGLFRPATDSLALATGGAERLRINSLGDVGIGETSPGARLDVRTATNRVALFNRTGDDGVLVNWQRDGFNQGSISVAAGVVSYNAFSGSHYAWTDETIPRGMLVSLTGQNRRQRGIADSEIIYGVTLTTRANDPRCLGAYLGLEEPRQPASDANPHQVASVGNGELWVTAAGGDIAPGDYLIAAAVPGCAMKDNPAEFAVGHIVARATENVKWQEVAADRDGLKRARINVLFENFERHGHASDPSLRQWIQHHEARTQQLEQENAQLKSRLDRLEKHLSGKN